GATLVVRGAALQAERGVAREHVDARQHGAALRAVSLRQRRARPRRRWRRRVAVRRAVAADEARPGGLGQADSAPAVAPRRARLAVVATGGELRATLQNVRVADLVRRARRRARGRRLLATREADHDVVGHLIREVTRCAVRRALPAAGRAPRKAAAERA